MPERVCEICGEVFWSPRLAKTCSTACAKERKKKKHDEWVANNKDKMADYMRSYYHEVIKPRQKEIYALYKDAIKERREQHKAERNARRRAVYAGRREEVLKQNAEWREQNKEIKKRIDREYREKNREEINRKARVRHRLRSLPTTTVEVDGKKLILFCCERLQLKSSRLPCGDKWQCWDKEPCQFIPKGKAELSFQSEVLGQQYNPWPFQKGNLK